MDAPRFAKQSGRFGGAGEDCSHISGLRLRNVIPLALMEFAGLTLFLERRKRATASRMASRFVQRGGEASRRFDRMARGRQSTGRVPRAPLDFGIVGEDSMSAMAPEPFTTHATRSNLAVSVIHMACVLQSDAIVRFAKAFSPRQSNRLLSVQLPDLFCSAITGAPWTCIMRSFVSW